MTDSPKTILVTGDFVFDHHIYEGSRHHFADGVSAGVRVIPQAGGAALVHDLLDVLSTPDIPKLVTEPSPTRNWRSQLAVTVPKADDVNESQRAYAFWRPFPRDASPAKQFWRVSEAMGFGSSAGSAPCQTWDQAEHPDHSDHPDILVLSEGGMDFRKTECCWNQLSFPKAKWIVMKTAAPIADGLLWNKLVSEAAGKLVIVVAASELRKSAARLSSGLSWDESLERLLHELQPKAPLHHLTQCRHLIVAFGSEGALWLDMKSIASPEQHRVAHFVYDPAAVEGEHAHTIEGTAFGFQSCLTAAVTWQIALQPESPDLEAACEGGLCAMRDLREKGHGPIAQKASGFPAKRLAKVIRKPNSRYSRARFSVPTDGGLPDDWSLVNESLRRFGPAFDLARLTAQRGPIALENVPNLKIGKLLTVDRREAESLRTLMQLMRHYKKHDSGKKPLSIGVFGPPGSGKSFAVEEIATQLVGADGWLEFNLSQFASPDDLIGAFHQIRDRVLKQKLPVVFFDEFDSQSYRWLQYLLAPMQDGKFQEGQVTHPIGKCIFIFAGGTSWTFETFGLLPASDGNPESGVCGALTSDERKALDTFRLAKGPDFKSRLDSYLNVVGPNQRQVASVNQNRFSFTPDPTDIYFPVRRALMVRSELKCAPETKLDIDEGVLNAMLRVPEFTHGSRSLSKLLQPLQVQKSGPLVRSLLSPISQMAMHTDAVRFLELCDSVPHRALNPRTMSGEAKMTPTDPLSEDEVLVVAIAINATYEVQGGRLKISEVETKGTGLFDQLDDFTKESNRAAARRMIRILDLIDLRLAPNENTPAERDELKRLFEFNLELLAEAEHIGWMQWHLDQGWRYDPLQNQFNDDGTKKTKDKFEKLHTCLLPFHQLDFAEQEKDRSSIRNYLEFAAHARKKIIDAQSAAVP